MASELRRGFKAAAERLALEVRAELHLDVLDRLDCVSLCELLGVPVISVPELAAGGASRESIRCIMASATKFSALTVASGTKRLIVYNPAHSAGRQANSLAHEISHVLLEHPMMSALGPGGCRNWDGVLEAEADWQAATLLVPRASAVAWMRRDGSIEDGAAHFGVSPALFRWRVGQTGVVQQLKAAARYG